MKQVIYSRVSQPCSCACSLSP